MFDAVSESYIRDIIEKRRFGAYELDREIARGCFGVIVSASDAKGKQVAIKLMHRPNDEPERNRFEAEMDALRRVRHPNILQYIDSGHVEGMPYLATEYVRGATLQEMIKKGLAAADISLIASKIAEGLGAVHECGYVHRDVKEENILVRRDAHLEPVLIDFGCVGDRIGRRDSVTIKFKEGVGTLPYMSSDQVRRALGEYTVPINPTDDFYAIGILLMRAITRDTPLVQGRLFLQPEAVPGSRDELRETLEAKQQLSPLLDEEVLDMHYGKSAPYWLGYFRAGRDIFRQLAVPEPGMRYQNGLHVAAGLKNLSTIFRNVDELTRRLFADLDEPRTLDVEWIHKAVSSLAYEQWMTACTIKFGKAVLASPSDYFRLKGEEYSGQEEPSLLLPRNTILGRDSMLVGRGQNHIFTIPDAKVSMNHAELGYWSGGFTLRDCGSRNGTFHNGDDLRFRKIALNCEDRIRFGRVTKYFITKKVGKGRGIQFKV